MKYLKLFKIDNDYQAFIKGEEFITPNLSCTLDTKITYFNPIINYSKEYLTFTALEDGMTISFNKQATSGTLNYSLDEGNTWNVLESNIATPSINAGEKIIFKGNLTPSSSNGMGRFSSTGKFNVEGNIMSMQYGDDFVDKNDLTGKDYVFSGLFSECKNVVKAHNLILPATTLADNCYHHMFYNCTSLTTAPAILPATTLAFGCYSLMFSNCRSLTSAPQLPATTLAEYCYNQMFGGCTSLTSAPQLPATTLTSWCYQFMFADCTSLTTAPELPATILGYMCYDYMFSGCTSLTSAPVLPATTLVNKCYEFMFCNCTSLNNIVMLATDISAAYCLSNWVSGVASTGTFTKNKDMTSLPTGNSGIPEGWEVKNVTPTECTSLTITADDVKCNQITTTIHYTAICNGVDYKGNTVTGIIEEGTAVSAEFPQNTSETDTVERTITFEFMGVTASTTITQGVYIPNEKQYLTFETIEDSTFKLTRNACEYSLDEGETWTSLSSGTNTPTVSAGNRIMFKATSPTISSSYGIGTFSSTGKFNVSGNIMSMLYGDNFVGQTDLTGKSCAFYKLFNNCTKVVEAHNLALPATTLAERCYYYMFYYCTSLTTAPELPATTLADYCYYRMFFGCKSLNNIVMLATDISATNCLYNWVYNVASTGTFVKHKDMTSLPTGVNGIPSGWEVKNHITPTECTNLTITAYNVIGNDTTATIHYTAIYNGIDYKGNTVTGIVEEGIAISAEFSQNTSETDTVERTITFEFIGVTASTTITQGVWVNFEQRQLTFKTIEDSTFNLSRNACEYSLDEGETWTSLSSGTNTPTVSAGNRIMFKATSPTISSSYGIGTFSSTGKFNVEGNIMSMLYGDDFVGQIDLTGKYSAFYNLFNNCTKVVEAHNLALPATTLARSCYSNMFNGCTSLTTAPELPATTLADYCYQYMFQDCTGLTTAPELPATTLADWCYQSMFNGCTSLTTAPALPATTLTENCYSNMFYGCTSLTSAPELPATTLANYCYFFMFQGCTGLTTAPELPATTLASGCYENMFRGCTSLTTAPELPATTLTDNCYFSMFAHCTSLTTPPELPATTLTESCYKYMFQSCRLLNYIKMLATDISANNCLSDWVYGVASTGTFVKSSGVNIPSGTSGIPSGWTVEEIGGVD